MLTATALSNPACRMGNFEMIPVLFYYVLPLVATAVTVTGLVGAAIFRLVTSK